MATGSMARVLGPLRRAALRQECGGLGDGRLLERFLAGREEEAFAALVRRHGPMVLGVCRHVLGNAHDAEDAFQATFLVLARRAASVAPADRVGHWLYGVARRTALKARAVAARRQRAERQAGAGRGRAVHPADEAGELRPLVAEELRRLPGKYGAPLALCLLEGQTRREAARKLGWSEGTLSGRLARAKALLATRLTRRGVPLAAAAGAAAVPAPLAEAAVRAAVASAPGAVPAHVLVLTEEVLKAMLVTKMKVVAAVVLAVGVAVGGGAVARQPGSASGEPVPAAPLKARPTAAGTAQRRPAPLPPYQVEPPDILLVGYSGKDDALRKQVAGDRLVRPDGTIGLGTYGPVSVTGLTLSQVKEAIAHKLRDSGADFDDKMLTVDVRAYNSKFYYVVWDKGRDGEQVTRVPATGNETVLDAIAQVDGLPAFAGKARVWLARPSPKDKWGREIILPVDWRGIAHRGESETNYQVLPGDRIHVAAETAPAAKPALHERSLYVPPGVPYPKLFDGARDAVDAVFGVAYAGRYDGRIESHPAAPQGESWWRPVTGFVHRELLGRWLGVRYRAVVTISAVDEKEGAFEVNVKVYRERRVAGAGRGDDETAWRPAGRSLALEQALFRYLVVVAEDSAKPGSAPPELRLRVDRRPAPTSPYSAATSARDLPPPKPAP